MLKKLVVTRARKMLPSTRPLGYLVSNATLTAWNGNRTLDNSDEKRTQVLTRSRPEAARKNGLKVDAA